MLSRCTKTRIRVTPPILLRRAYSSSNSVSQQNNKRKKTAAVVAATAVVTAAASAFYANSNNGLIRNDSRPVESSKLPGKYSAVTGSLVEFPRAASAASFSSKSTRMLDEQDVSAKIRENEESYLVDRDSGVTRFDINQLASNPQIEDDFTAKIVNVGFADGNHDWYFFGVFDGHGCVL